MLQKNSDRLSPLLLPVKIVQMLYTERVISKKTLYEANRLESVLGDGPSRALCSTVSKESNKLKTLATILIKSEQIDLLLMMYSKITVTFYNQFIFFTDHTFPSQVKLQPVYQHNFAQMRVAFGGLNLTLSSLIKADIPSLDDLKMFCENVLRS